MKKEVKIVTLPLKGINPSQQILILSDDEITEGDLVSRGSLIVKAESLGGTLGYKQSLAFIYFNPHQDDGKKDSYKIIASYPQLTGTLPISQDTVQKWIDTGCPNGGSVEVEPFSAYPQTVYVIKPGEGLEIEFETRKAPFPEANLPVKGFTVFTHGEIKEKAETHFYQNNNKGKYMGASSKWSHIITYQEAYKQALKDMGHSCD